MKRAALLLVALVALIACSRTPQGPSENDRVRAAADTAFRFLTEGKVDSFVAFIHGADSLPESYRQQLADLMRQFIAEQKRLHGGIVAARAVDDTIEGRSADVRIELTYGDSSRECISQPMVDVGGRWRMQ